MATDTTSHSQNESAMPTVGDLLKSRQAGIRDNYRLALALEGGGMRGVVSGAMLIALRALGLGDLFDRYYGTSSGAINLTHFAVGGTWDALSVYYDHLPNGFLRRGGGLLVSPPLNMNYVFDDVMVHKVPLRDDLLAGSALDVRLILTNVDAIEPRIVPIQAVASEARAYLKAASWLPLLSGTPHALHGVRFLDGGVLYPDPLYAALQETCTHILCLNTSSEVQSEHSKRARALLKGVLNRWTTGLGDAYAVSRLMWDRDKAQLGRGQDALLRGASVLRLAPERRSHRVTRLTMDRGDLLDGARAGYSAVFEHFGAPLGKSYFSITGSHGD